MPEVVAVSYRCDAPHRSLETPLPVIRSRRPSTALVVAPRVPMPEVVLETVVALLEVLEPVTMPMPVEGPVHW